MAQDAQVETLGDGRYVVMGLLAEGSQGATLDAVDKKKGQPVAIKRFQVKGARSWKDVELAEREARVLGQLSHRHLPAYVDYFEQDGALYLVMEKIEGESLREILQREGQLSPRLVVRFLHDAGAVLDYLHDRAVPVIHRDIKPANVIRRPDGSFVLVDFGSVRAELKPKGGSTVVGTFGYMAPEQLQGRAMPATDVYGVGVTALALLTGVEPENLPHRGLAIDVAAALAGRVRVVPELVELLRALVEPDPDQRCGRLAPLLAKLPKDLVPQRRQPPQANNDAAAADSAVVGKKSDSSAHAGRGQSGSDTGPRRPLPPMGRRPRRPRHPVAPHDHHLPPLVALVALIALSVARIAVAMGLRVVVPLILTTLSLFFGKPLREAARSVRLAGRRAGAALSQAQYRVQPVRARFRRSSLNQRRGRRRHGADPSWRSRVPPPVQSEGGQSADDASSTATPADDGRRAKASRQRVADSSLERPRRGRIDDPEQRAELQDAFAEMEQAMREVDEQLSRKRRRR